MGISLLIFAMLLSVWAMTSMLWAETAVGACTEPCDDTGSQELIECGDEDVNGPCTLTKCWINTFYTLACTGECDTPCDYHEGPGEGDPNESVARRIVEYDNIECTDNGRETLNLGDCVFAKVHDDPVGAPWTPCGTDSCDGDPNDRTEWDDVYGQLLCGSE